MGYYSAANSGTKPPQIWVPNRRTKGYHSAAKGYQTAAEDVNKHVNARVGYQTAAAVPSPLLIVKNGYHSAALRDETFGVPFRRKAIRSLSRKT